MKIGARQMREGDPEALEESFAGTPWARGVPFFADLLARHAAGERVALVGALGAHAVAFGSLLWESAYPPFREAGIPEIQDLNVCPRWRHRGVATAILDLAERLAFERSELVGIGFGLHPGYRAAQRLYVLRGYVPDGRGVFCAGRFPEEGEQVALDDRLLLYLTKPRPPRHAA